MPEAVAAPPVLETEAPKVGAETNVEVAATKEAKSETNSVGSIGKSQRATFDMDAFEDNEALKQTQPQEETKAAEITKVAEATKEASQFDEGALKAYFEKNGIEFESMDKLKEKLKPKEISTPEEIQRKKLAEDKSRVDIYVEGGGTVDQYVKIKEMANSDLKDLSLKLVKEEYKNLGFSDEEISDLIKERYYQLSDEEIDELDDDGKELTKKLKDAFSKKLENKASYIQKSAKDFLAGLDKHIEEEDLRVENEKVLSSKVDDILKKAPRKITFEIGESDGKVITPVDFEVSESDIDEVKMLLKDSEKRNNFLNNKDGSLNITNISNVLLREKVLQKAVKLAYLEATNRSAELIDSVYPSRNPYDVGVGGQYKPNSFSKGQVAKVGKTQRV